MNKSRKPARAAVAQRWTRPAIAIGVAATTMLAGYGDLWRGGNTLSAVLLFLAYLILVPVAILAVPRDDEKQ